MAGPTPLFIELGPFTAQWASLGLTDTHLAELQTQLAANPAAGAVVRGGGLRKVRFAPGGWTTGRRGALRVYYADIPGLGVVVLATAFAKSATGDVSRAMVQDLAAMVSAIRGVANGEG
jgi:hypothetical protein